VKRWGFKLLRKHIDKFVVVDRQVERELAAVGIPFEGLTFIPNGVDTNHFTPLAEKTDWFKLRTALGLSLDKQVVIYVGRLERIKGVDVLLRAWRLLCEDFCEAHLVIVGSGSERHTLQQLVSSMSLSNEVTFAGEQSDILTYLRAADIFILPSRSEGISNALLEAMACGLPALCSAVGGTVGVIRDQENGLLFESENEFALSQGLSRLLRRKDLQIELGLKARQTVIDHFSLDVVTQKYEQIYAQLTSGRLGK
jgi:glycosyltransferase involved in cell wall biosynthesis